MKLPKKKKINGKVWKIADIEFPRNDKGTQVNSFAHFFPEDVRTIMIKQKMGKDQKLKAYLAECLHAHYHELGQERNERQVNDLVKTILSLFKIIPR